MVEKRVDRFSLTSRKDLINFFSDTLPKKTIKEIIRAQKKSFVKRSGASLRENAMQFIKKCEWELVRRSKKHLAESERKKP